MDSAVQKYNVKQIFKKCVKTINVYVPYNLTNSVKRAFILI
jgi:hypothetical protein